MEWILIALAVVVGILALFIALWLLLALVHGAVVLFGSAARSGFVGIAVYVACWVFLAPVMIVGSIVIGGLRKLVRQEWYN